MRRLFAWWLSHTAYCLGNVVSLLMRACDRCHLYPIYSQLMVWSMELNDWGGLELWVPAERSDEQ
jgi:hypothetical protein